MPGPLPKDPDKKVRRNQPTIPTSNLPVGGLRDPSDPSKKRRAPTVPRGYTLGDAGKRWWKWAWGLPQAAGWDDGALVTLVRRAQLEDDLAALESIGGDFDMAEYLGIEWTDALRDLNFILERMRSNASGRLAILKAQNDFDKALGLNPKALADLRWKIVADPDEQKAKPDRKSSAARRGHLQAVDPAAAATSA